MLLFLDNTAVKQIDLSPILVSCLVLLGWLPVLELNDNTTICVALRSSETCHRICCGLILVSCYQLLYEFIHIDLDVFVVSNCNMFSLLQISPSLAKVLLHRHAWSVEDIEKRYVSRTVSCWKCFRKCWLMVWLCVSGVLTCSIGLMPNYDYTYMIQL